MAKGSAMGLWRGKKGSSVFYQIKNSNSLQKQGIRERNYEPSNPRSYNQAGQRMRMYPAQAVYGAIKDVIERSWQGVPYGQMSRQEYLARALKQPIVPAVDKGLGVVVPAPYQIAKGTLQEIPVTNITADAHVYPLYATDEFDQTDAVGVISRAILASNPFIKDGDQLSFVVCASNTDGFGFLWNVFSFVVDSTSTEDLLPELGPIGDFSFILNASGLSISYRGDSILYASAIILSRDGSTPLRSNATLAVNYTIGEMPNYYTPEAMQRARRSYMNPEYRRETDWPADPDGGGGISGAVVIAVDRVAFGESGAEVDAASGGSVEGGGVFQPGDLVTIAATPSANFSFAGWYASKEDATANENRLSSQRQISFAAGEGEFSSVRTFWASFVQNP